MVKLANFESCSPTQKRTLSVFKVYGKQEKLNVDLYPHNFPFPSLSKHRIGAIGG